MTPTLVRHHGRTETSTRTAPGDRARDWAEIQERMLAPLYEAVYARLEVGSGTRLLSLGCGSGLSLLIAAARGARVTGVDTDLERLALARTRLLPGPDGDAGSPAGQPRLLEGDPSAARPSDGTPYDLITAFTPIGCSSDDGEGLVAALRSAVPLAARGSTVVLTGWGPPERCATAPVLRVAERLCGRDRAPRTGDWRPSGRDDLEELAFRAGLNPDGSGRVACPFGYADTDSAVRGLLSTRLFDAAVRATDRAQVEKEVTQALRPHRRRDGTVWMPNVFRYLVCST
ncbi:MULTISPECIES: methyltransferase domain-containing protein [unclassified Streptomyces]|jgi:SAM-dependent methyltransferase|uniref:class I SAM-dependent methyltransferase n=1 Tax=unclassified Streptomyces TaxID=2593676 RepID=UPI00081B69CD|nr:MULTISPECIES: methyltransferase domain-containing protein [unclassified Streptomyces]MYQ86542.1 methyltransferase domain-containing protein [Streptomyces sp. SID4936]SCE26148.1 Methyltransferase domain-containing protein [Streptomyces sp. DvalAA-43]